MIGTIKLYRTGEPGSLGAVCKAYFDNPEHKGCPFQQVCCVDNGLPKDSAVLRILYSTDAETLEVMAKAIRSTMKEN